MPASLALILTWQRFFDAGSCGRQLPDSLLVVLVLRQPALAGKHVARLASHALHLHLQNDDDNIKIKNKKLFKKRNKDDTYPFSVSGIFGTVQFSSRSYLCARKSPYVLHMSPRGFPNTAFETVPMFI